MAEFSDHFSKQAGAYAEFRPTYPRALFAWLRSLCASHELCWDAATGNGQAAEVLAEYFAEVYASDASAKQIAQARPHAKIRYKAEPAEESSLADHSCDLITVAQAFHWFDHDAFYAEVKRVIKPGGVLAVWGYGLHKMEPAIDAIVHKYYTEIVGEYWPPERRHVEQHYAGIKFPFNEIPAPALAIEENYSLRQLIGYLDSWSATQGYIKARGESPLRLIGSDLEKAWGDAATRRIQWPLFFKVARL